MHITSAGRTDVGVIRSGNEDSFRMIPDRGIFVVADGMGGHAAGEVASEMAVRIVADEIHSLRGLTDQPYDLPTWRIVVKNWRTLRRFHQTNRRPGGWLEGVK